MDKFSILYDDVPGKSVTIKPVERTDSILFGFNLGVANAAYDHFRKNATWEFYPKEEDLSDTDMKSYLLLMAEIENALTKTNYLPNQPINIRGFSHLVWFHLKLDPTVTGIFFSALDEMQRACSEDYKESFKTVIQVGLHRISYLKSNPIEGDMKEFFSECMEMKDSYARIVYFFFYSLHLPDPTLVATKWGRKIELIHV